MDDGYNEDEYIKIYTDYIKKLQALPSKPIVMLQVPVTTRLTMNHGKECITNNNDPYFPAFHPSCTQLSMLDQQRTFYKIANLTGIPEHHVVNGWFLLRLNPNVAAKEVYLDDNTHPNLRGMGVLA